MTLHQVRTPLSPREVIERALSFFPLAGTPYAAFPEAVSRGHLKLHLEVGEIVIAAVRKGDATLVRGSGSRGTHLLTRFLTTLAAPLDVGQTTHRYTVHRTLSAGVETFAAQPACEPEPLLQAA